MRLVKLTLLCLIAASLGMMWSNRDYVTDAYETTPNTMQVRLSGVDLAVTRTEIEPSPFLIPAAPDTRRFPLPALSRPEPVETAPEIELTGGKARISGTVLGPDGPVLGTTVRIERHTSHGSGSINVAADPAGFWTVGGLPGGRYRIRAWVPGLMTTGGSDVRYLADDEKAEFEFTMWGVDPTPAFELVHGGPIYAGQPGTVAVVLTKRFIDDEGVVVTAPLVGGLITIETTPEVTVSSSPVQLTDVTGTAWYTLTCIGDRPTGTLTARSGAVVDVFPLPGCRPVPVPEPRSAPEDQPTDTEQPATPSGQGALDNG